MAIHETPKLANRTFLELTAEEHVFIVGNTYPFSRQIMGWFHHVDIRGKKASSSMNVYQV